MAIQPKPFKIYCSKCGFEKLIWFKSDALMGSDFEQVLEVCPKCDNTKLNRKTASIEEAMAKERFENIIQTFKNIFKKVFKG